MSVTPITSSAAAPMPTGAVTSPYDGTSPSLAATALAGSPGLTGGAGYGVPTLTGPTGSGSGPQVNATNQTALAPNGDVNQSVTNQNQYTNKYYNIIVPNSALGGFGNLGGMFGGSVLGNTGNAFIDPQTGVLYVQRDHSVLGWFHRLFTGGY